MPTPSPCLLLPERFHELVHEYEPPLEMHHDGLLARYDRCSSANFAVIFFYIQIAREYTLNDFLPMVVPRVYEHAFAFFHEEQRLIDFLPLYFIYRQSERTFADLADTACVARSSPT
jgi:hypothetical protein